MSTDLRALMNRYCAGDASAFRALYQEVAPRLLGYLVRLARDRTVAEDLLQQTFWKVHRARAAYVAGADPLPWIYAIAHRTFLDEARRRSRAATVTAPEELPEVRATATGEPEAVAAEHPPVDPEQAKAALDALASLPAPQREAVILTKLDGKSFREAAEIAGTTTGAMKVRAHRGYVALRKALGGRP
ncbi:MAG TPA: RNA polymerase sigma factor [Kofleriaceae bacterium]|nr:RNA polymerase sigma factor [Kofleriaceae bacterium]